MNYLDIPDTVLRFDGFTLAVPRLLLPEGFIKLDGPNGSGKSTFIRNTLSFLHSKKKSEECGFVPQNYDHALLPWLSSIRNLTSFGISETTARRNLIKNGLPEDVLSIRPFKLSGGQRQMLLLTREILLDPNILFLDEPFSSLDANAIECISESLAEFAARPMRRIIAASHIAFSEKLTIATTLTIFPRGARFYELSNS